MNYDDVMKRLKMVFEKNGVKENEKNPFFQKSEARRFRMFTSCIWLFYTLDNHLVSESFSEFLWKYSGDEYGDLEDEYL